MLRPRVGRALGEVKAVGGRGLDARVGLLEQNEQPLEPGGQLAPLQLPPPEIRADGPSLPGGVGGGLGRGARLLGVAH